VAGQGVNDLPQLLWVALGNLQHLLSAVLRQAAVHQRGQVSTAQHVKNSTGPGPAKQ
jgi:hypothetical protein